MAKKRKKKKGDNGTHLPLLPRKKEGNWKRREEGNDGRRRKHLRGCGVEMTGKREKRRGESHFQPFITFAPGVAGKGVNRRGLKKKENREEKEKKKKKRGRSASFPLLPVSNNSEDKKRKG